MNLSALTQKKWGLPIWVWAIIAAVILFGMYVILRRRGNSSSISNASPSNASPNSGTVPNPIDTSGSGGGLGVPDTTQPDPVTVVGSSNGGNNNTEPVTTTVSDTPAPSSPTNSVTTAPSTSPSKPNASPSSSTIASSVLVPVNATATSLQAGVAKVGPSAVVIPSTPLIKAQLAHPAAVKITANKTGGSANKAQGVFAVH